MRFFEFCRPKMEFPITRKRLQNYREEEATEVNAKQRLSKIIEKICKDIENILLTSDERKYVYRIEGSVYGKLPVSNSPRPYLQERSILPDIVDTLKTLFPDSNVVVDPLITYIMIDWS